MYKYNAVVLRVVDADTMDLQIDLGFGISTRQRVRLAEVNAYEQSSEQGQIATLWVKDLVTKANSQCVVTTRKKGKWGRWIAFLWIDGLELNDALIDNGYAKPYLTS